MSECKNLISRMLVTDPKARASLSEIINHPWITKGFNTVPENYLPYREPIQLPLDPSIVEKMTGFDFGSSDFITRELTKVITSDEYQNAVRLNTREQSAQAQGNDKRRGVFDFYERRSSATSRGHSSECIRGSCTARSGSGLRLDTFDRKFDIIFRRFSCPSPLFIHVVILFAH